MGDFGDALAALLGKDAPNLSPSVVARLQGEWEADYKRWQRRDLSARRHVYVWADVIYLQARMEPQAECMLVLIGATPEGRKELLCKSAAGFGADQRDKTLRRQISPGSCSRSDTHPVRSVAAHLRQRRLVGAGKDVVADERPRRARRRHAPDAVNVGEAVVGQQLPCFWICAPK
jgi:hypothetical protein